MLIKDDLLRNSVTSTAKENDLKFFAAVLSEINYVVSQTYGPEAGYVAQHDPSTESGITYSKDGLTTLTSLTLSEEADNVVLNMVKTLAREIKSRSGDGSTTGAKLLYYLIKNALTRMNNGEYSPDEIRSIRVNTPKALPYVINFFIKKLEEISHNKLSLEDLRHAALIALNNDEALMQPFDDIFKLMEEHKAKIDSSWSVNVYNNPRMLDLYRVMRNPGYVLGVKEMAIDPNLKEMDNAKVIIIPSNFTVDMLHFIVAPIAQAAQELSRQKKILFLVNYVDEESKFYLKKLLKQAQSQNTDFHFDIIEISEQAQIPGRLDDLSYMLNTNPILLNDLIHKRKELGPEDEIDNPNTTNLMKWTFKANPDGTYDKDYGKAQYLTRYFEELVNSFSCNIRVIPHLGLTVSLTDEARENIPEEYKVLYERHISGLQEAAESDDQEISENAKMRLYYLKDNHYSLYIGRQTGDHVRLYTAYLDATRALSSIAKYGYTIGGSYAPFHIFYDKPDYDIKDKNIERAATFLSEVLRESLFNVFTDLKAEYANLNIEEVHDHADINNCTIDGIPVIVPVETDLVIIPMTLRLFSNMFSSLLVEFSNTTDAGRAKFVAIEVGNALEKFAKPKTEPTPDPTPEPSEPEPEVEEPVIVPVGNLIVDDANEEYVVDYAEEEEVEEEEESEDYGLEWEENNEVDDETNIVDDFNSNDLFSYEDDEYINIDDYLAPTEPDTEEVSAEETPVDKEVWDDMNDDWGFSNGLTDSETPVDPATESVSADMYFDDIEHPNDWSMFDNIEVPEPQPEPTPITQEESFKTPEPLPRYETKQTDSNVIIAVPVDKIDPNSEVLLQKQAIIEEMLGSASDETGRQLRAQLAEQMLSEGVAANEEDEVKRLIAKRASVFSGGDEWEIVDTDNEANVRILQ